MPLHLPPVSRRGFLAGAAAGLSGMLMLDVSAAGGDRNSLALLADTHIPSDPATEARGTTMADNLRRVVQELRTLKSRPAGAIINGDCAYLAGKRSDYELLGRLLQPLRQDNWPVHLTMGNHDDRDSFGEVLGELAPAHRPVESRLVTVLRTPHANWFLLDTLDQVNLTPGELGRLQRTWLEHALDEHDDKPALIVGHHNPQWPDPNTTRLTGLTDTPALFDLLAPRQHVKAYIYGHTHAWGVRQHQGIYLVNLPPVAYVFDAGRPNGWVHATAHTDRLDLRLHALDPKHRQHGELLHLNWR